MLSEHAREPKGKLLKIEDAVIELLHDDFSFEHIIKHIVEELAAAPLIKVGIVSLINFQSSHES